MVSLDTNWVYSLDILPMVYPRGGGEEGKWFFETRNMHKINFQEFFGGPLLIIFSLNVLLS